VSGAAACCGLSAANLLPGQRPRSQANDLAKQMPEKLHELQQLWLIEATRYNVLPIDDRTAERFNPDTAGRC